MAKVFRAAKITGTRYWGVQEIILDDHPMRSGEMLSYSYVGEKKRSDGKVEIPGYPTKRDAVSAAKGKNMSESRKKKRYN